MSQVCKNKIISVQSQKVLSLIYMLATLCRTRARVNRQEILKSVHVDCTVN